MTSEKWVSSCRTSTSRKSTIWTHLRSERSIDMEKFSRRELLKRAALSLPLFALAVAPQSILTSCTKEPLPLIDVNEGCEDCTNACKGTCNNTCTDTCSGHCDVTCQGSCGNTCKGKCTKNCSSDCYSYCENTCKGTCEAICSNSCQGSCKGDCSSSCYHDCINSSY